MKMKLYAFLFASVFLMACSTTVTGPITKNKYNIDVGCTDDMRDYQKTREEVVIEGMKKEKIKIDCPTSE